MLCCCYSYQHALHLCIILFFFSHIMFAFCSCFSQFFFFFFLFNPPTQNATSYEQQITKQTISSSTVPNGIYNNTNATSGSPTFNSLPRTSTPHNQQQQQQQQQQNSSLYMNGGGGVGNGGGTATSGNISELDSLLQDLSNARYGSGIEKKCEYIKRNITW